MVPWRIPRMKWMAGIAAIDTNSGFRRGARIEKDAIRRRMPCGASASRSGNWSERATKIEDTDRPATA